MFTLQVPGWSRVGRRPSEDTKRSEVPQRPLTSRAGTGDHDGKGRPDRPAWSRFDRPNNGCLRYDTVESDEVSYLSVAQRPRRPSADSQKSSCCCHPRFSPEDLFTVPCDVIRIDQGSPRLGWPKVLADEVEHHLQCKGAAPSEAI